MSSASKRCNGWFQVWKRRDNNIQKEEANVLFYNYKMVISAKMTHSQNMDSESGY